jgi:hypothetical protein
MTPDRANHEDGQFQTWLDGGGKNPHEQVMKSRLREML